MEKNIKNIDAISRMFKLASTKITNNRLKVAKEEKQKKEKMIRM